MSENSPGYDPTMTGAKTDRDFTIGPSASPEDKQAHADALIHLAGEAERRKASEDLNKKTPDTKDIVMNEPMPVLPKDWKGKVVMEIGPGYGAIHPRWEGYDQPKEDLSQTALILVDVDPTVVDRGMLETLRAQGYGYVQFVHGEGVAALNELPPDRVDRININNVLTRPGIQTSVDLTQLIDTAKDKLKPGEGKLRIVETNTPEVVSPGSYSLATIASEGEKLGTVDVVNYRDKPDDSRFGPYAGSADPAHSYVVEITKGPNASNENASSNESSRPGEGSVEELKPSVTAQVEPSAINQQITENEAARAVDTQDVQKNEGVSAREQLLKDTAQTTETEVVGSPPVRLRDPERLTVEASSTYLATQQKMQGEFNEKLAEVQREVQEARENNPAKVISGPIIVVEGTGRQVAVETTIIDNEGNGKFKETLLLVVKDPETGEVVGYRRLGVGENTRGDALIAGGSIHIRDRGTGLAKYIETAAEQALAKVANEQGKPVRWIVIDNNQHAIQKTQEQIDGLGTSAQDVTERARLQTELSERIAENQRWQTMWGPKGKMGFDERHTKFIQPSGSGGVPLEKIGRIKVSIATQEGGVRRGQIKEETLKPSGDRALGATPPSDTALLEQILETQRNRDMLEGLLREKMGGEPRTQAREGGVQEKAAQPDVPPKKIGVEESQKPVVSARSGGSEAQKPVSRAGTEVSSKPVLGRDGAPIPGVREVISIGADGRPHQRTEVLVEIPGLTKGDLDRGGGLGQIQGAIQRAEELLGDRPVDIRINLPDGKSEVIRVVRVEPSLQRLADARKVAGGQTRNSASSQARASILGGTDLKIQRTFKIGDERGFTTETRLPYAPPLNPLITDLGTPSNPDQTHFINPADGSQYIVNGMRLLPGEAISMPTGESIFTTVRTIGPDGKVQTTIVNVIPRSSPDLGILDQEEMQERGRDINELTKAVFRGSANARDAGVTARDIDQLIRLQEIGRAADQRMSEIMASTPREANEPIGSGRAERQAAMGQSGRPNEQNPDARAPQIRRGGGAPPQPLGPYHPNPEGGAAVPEFPEAKPRAPITPGSILRGLGSIGGAIAEKLGGGTSKGFGDEGVDPEPPSDTQTPAPVETMGDVRPSIRDIRGDLDRLAPQIGGAERRYLENLVRSGQAASVEEALSISADVDAERNRQEEARQERERVRQDEGRAMQEAEQERLDSLAEKRQEETEENMRQEQARIDAQRQGNTVDPDEGGDTPTDSETPFPDEQESPPTETTTPPSLSEVEDEPPSESRSPDSQSQETGDNASEDAEPWPPRDDSPQEDSQPQEPRPVETPPPKETGKPYDGEFDHDPSPTQTSVPERSSQTRPPGGGNRPTPGGNGKILPPAQELGDLSPKNLKQLDGILDSAGSRVAKDDPTYEKYRDAIDRARAAISDGKPPSVQDMLDLLPLQRGANQIIAERLSGRNSAPTAPTERPSAPVFNPPVETLPRAKGFAEFIGGLPEKGESEISGGSTSKDMNQPTSRSQDDEPTIKS